MKIIVGIVIVIVLVIIGFALFSEKPPADLEQAQVVDRAPSGSESEDDHDHDEMDDHDHEDEMVSEKVDIPNSAVIFSFVGFGPGKSHPGTFEDYNISDVVMDENGIPTSGKIVFKVESVRTDSSVLDDHLCRDNFFDCANHKEITFILDSAVSEDGTNYDVTGDLTFKGVTKAITFPVIFDSESNSVSSDFKLNSSDFGFGGPGVNEEVQIKITGTL